MLDVSAEARRSAPTIAAGPPLDFQAHLAALEAQGLLRARRSARSTRTPSCTRWCAGSSRAGSPKSQRRAFLFTNVIDSSGRRYDIPVAVGALAASPQIYAVGMGRPVEEIEAAWMRAIANPIAPVAVSSPACQAVVIEGDDAARRRQGLGAPAGADLDAGLRCGALSHRDALRHARSRHRHPEHGHLPRRAQGDRPARRAHGLAHRRRRRLSALAEAQQARRADAVRDRHRLRAGRHVHRRHEARRRSRRDGGRRRASPARRSGWRRRSPSISTCRPTPRS